MERILDENEKLRRAEQIYFKRNNREISLSEEKVHKEKGLGLCASKSFLTFYEYECG